MSEGQSHQLDDHIFIERTLNGEMGAYGLLINRYKYMVFTLAVRMLRNREEAEEVAQDTFIKAYNNLAQYTASAKFSTWLFKIAYNQSLDYLKRSRRKYEFTQLDPENDRGNILLPAIIRKLDQEDHKRILNQAMNRLSEENSLIITLFYLEELSLEEISLIMGITTNTAKVRLHRSRKQLAELMMQYKEQYTPGAYGYQ